jgi:hypothetical protein
MTIVRDFIARCAGVLGIDLGGTGGEDATNAVFDIYVRQSVAAVSADASRSEFVYHNSTGYKLQLISAKLISTGTLTANGSNYAEITVSHGTVGAFLSAATCSTDSDVAAGAGGTGDWVADTPEPLLLSSTQANLELAEGGYTKVLTDSTPGTGVAVPQYLLALRYRRK